MVWHFIGVYIINRTLHDRLEIRNFSSRVEKYFTRSLRSLVKYFSTLEEKFRISARPCNILYLFSNDVRLERCVGDNKNLIIVFFSIGNVLTTSIHNGAEGLNGIGEDIEEKINEIKELVKKKGWNKKRRQLLRLLDELSAMAEECVAVPPEPGRQKERERGRELNESRLFSLYKVVLCLFACKEKNIHYN